MLSPGPHDLEWAQAVLNFELGKSELKDRFRVIAQWLGGQQRLIDASGAPSGTVMSWLKRGSQPSDVGRLASETGLSELYLRTGQVVNAKDLAVEELRLNLARGDFSAAGVAEVRRAARKRVIAEAEAAIASLRMTLLHEGAGGLAEEDGAAPEEATRFVAVPDLAARFGFPALPQRNGAAAVQIREGRLRELGLVPGASALLRMTGDSMAPEIAPGSILVVDLSAKGQQLRHGMIYVFVVERDFIVRRLERRVGGAAELVPTNPNYRPEPLAPDAASHVAGRVAWVARPV